MGKLNSYNDYYFHKEKSQEDNSIYSKFNIKLVESENKSIREFTV